MTEGVIVLTLLSSAVSGILGVFISSAFYSKMEKKRIKLETARKLFGSKHDITGKEFQEAINELIVVFSDNRQVICSVQRLFEVLESPRELRASGAADEALIQLMKAVCKSVGIKYKNLPDSYYLKFLGVPRQVTS